MTCDRMLRLAHRGDWRRAPENTIPAFLAALEVEACDGLELDVRISRDGVPVVIHDETLARVQRRPGRVDELRAAALGDAGVPTLEAVLDAFPGSAFLDVELKGEAHGEATAAVLRSARGEDGRRAVVSSFDPPALVAMEVHLPGWTRWLNATDLGPSTLSLARGLGCGGVSVLWGAITPASLRAARLADLDVAAWTVRRVATRDRLERLGVVACCVEAAALDR
ncbi:MAG TPA: glycerophosphodiester phosphodiesterase [Candidatus Limnocylindrales bacterium]|nr:glycerophosphodiester phosphodiesterase [Candidatus Limnocylindrales bacterium]